MDQKTRAALDSLKSLAIAACGYAAEKTWGQELAEERQRIEGHYKEVFFAIAPDAEYEPLSRR